MKQFFLSIMILITCISIIAFNCNKPLPSINQKSYCDSISSLNFEYENRLNRYEITLEILRDENPKLAEEFETIMSTQTE
jgi:hypothetical protein